MSQLTYILIYIATALLSSFLVYFFVFPRVTGISLAKYKLVSGLIFAPLQALVSCIAIAAAFVIFTYANLFVSLSGGVAPLPVIWTFGLGIAVVILFIANLILIAIYKAVGLITIDKFYASTKAAIVLMVLQFFACIIALLGGAQFVDPDSTIFDHSYQYINQNGDIEINDGYDLAMPFHNYIAEVRRIGSRSVECIDLLGETVPAPNTPKPKRRNTMDDDPALYESDENISLHPDSLIKTNGMECIPFSEELAIARKIGTANWGYIDSNYEFKIPPQFCDARRFSEGLAAVQKESGVNSEKLWGYIDTTGKFVIPCKFVSAKSFNDGLAAASIYVGSGKNKKEKFGYIEPTGEFVIKPKYAFASSFSEGRAAVRKLP